MRARLNLLVLGVASLVVIAFVVPLALTVRQQADERGRIQAERTAQTLAAVVVRSTAASDSAIPDAELAELIGPIPAGSALVFPDGEVIGDADPDESLVEEVVARQTALSAYSDAGFGLAIPVSTQAGTVVVFGQVDKAVLREGVTTAWTLLGALGLGLVLASLFLADRLGRSVVGPSTRIAAAARQLGHGNLESRVDEEGPPELVAISVAFNQLADRIEALLAEEREALADLSHRLRTPLTALVLQAEQLPSSPAKQAVLEKVDLVRNAVDELITQARTRTEPGLPTCDLVEVVRSRAEFWRVLADEQGREFKVDLTDSAGPIGATEAETAAAVDALLGNVFAHTPSGTDFGIAVRRLGDILEVEVADQGPGFPSGLDPLDRGASGAESSGLGLDIARRLADSVGGSIRTASSPIAGARVMLEIPLAE